MIVCSGLKLFIPCVAYVSRQPRLQATANTGISAVGMPTMLSGLITCLRTKDTSDIQCSMVGHELVRME